VVGANAAWLVGCRIGADLMSFALFLVVSRRFGPDGLGVYAYGFAIAGVIYALTTSGIEEYGIREYARRVHDRTAEAAASRSELMSDLVGAQCCIAVAALGLLAVYLLLTQPSTATLMVVLSLSLYQIGSAFSGTLFIPAMAAQRMVEPALAEFLCRAAAFTVAGGLILGGAAELHVALTAFACAGAAMAAVAARSAYRRGVRLRARASVATLGKSLRELWPFALVNTFNQLFTRIGVIALALLVSEAAAGVYATGLKLVETVLMPIAYMCVAAYPRLSQAYARDSDFANVSRGVLSVGIALTAVAACGLYVVAPPLLVPVFGGGFKGAEPLIAAMAGLAAVQGVELVLGRLLLAGNRHIVRAAALCAGAVACVVITVAVTPRYGAYGALSVAVSAYVLVCALYALNLRDVLRRVVVAPPRGSMA
jgi:O-antigen/teichoic acid export membrane protein